MIDEPGTISYNVEQGESKAYFHRFVSYLGYKKFVIDCLKRNKYDKIVISTVAIAIFLYPYLKRHYRKKYVFDIRDYSLILNFTRCIMKKVIDNSAATVISSPGFTNWLPKSSKYYFAHNFPFELEKENGEFVKDSQEFTWSSKHLEITTIGSLRDFDANKLLIDAFKYETRFKLNFIGTGPAYTRLKNYVLDTEVTNTFFYGFYQKKDESNLLVNSDFINNYTDHDLNSRTLMTNRFYLSVVLGIPMIVRSGTYQAELCERYNLGCIIESHRDISGQLEKFISSFKNIEYLDGRASFLRVFKSDTDKLRLFLLDFITSH